MEWSFVTKEFMRTFSAELSPATVRRPTDNAITERFYGTNKQEEIFVVGSYHDLRSAKNEIVATSLITTIAGFTRLAGTSTPTTSIERKTSPRYLPNLTIFSTCDSSSTLDHTKTISEYDGQDNIAWVPIVFGN
jgi:transposase InsO family protein